MSEGKWMVTPFGLCFFRPLITRRYVDHYFASSLKCMFLVFPLLLKSETELVVPLVIDVRHSGWK